MKILLFLIIGIFFCLKADVSVLDKNENYQLNSYLEFIEDETGEKAFSEIQNLEFQKLKEGQISKFSSSAFWFKIKIKNKTDESHWIFEIGYPLLDSVDIYSSAHQFLKLETGDKKKFNSRKINYRNFAFPVNLEEDLILYIRIKSDGPFIFPMSISGYPYFISKINLENYILGAYFGIIIIMMIYNLVLFISVKDSTYLIYVFHILFFGLLQGALSGFNFENLWPDFPEFANITPLLFFALSLLSISAFTNKFLILKYNYKTGRKIVFSLIAFYFIYAIVSLSDSHYREKLIFLGYSAIFSSILLLYIAYVVHKRGFHSARYFLAGWTFLFLAIITNRLRVLGFFPENLISIYGMQISSVFEMTFLSFALGVRLTDLKKEKEKIERDKQNLIIDIHDNLGGDLTDIVYYLNKFLSKDKLLEEDVYTLKSVAERALNSLRMTVHLAQDLESLDEDFLYGLRFYIITRYSNSGREFKTYLSEEDEVKWERLKDRKIQDEILLICKEISTNDLKYGKEESIWKFEGDEKCLTISVTSKTRYEKEKSSGLGTMTLKKRADRIGALLSFKIENEIFELILKISV